MSIKYFYDGTNYDSLEEAKSLAREWYQEVLAKPTLFMQAKQVWKHDVNTYIVGDISLNDEEILQYNEGTFLVSGEVNGQLLEVNDLSESVRQYRHAWCEYNPNKIYVFEVTFDENEEEVDCIMHDVRLEVHHGSSV